MATYTLELLDTVSVHSRLLPVPDAAKPDPQAHVVEPAVAVLPGVQG